MTSGIFLGLIRYIFVVIISRHFRSSYSYFAYLSKRINTNQSRVCITNSHQNGLTN